MELQDAEQPLHLGSKTAPGDVSQPQFQLGERGSCPSSTTITHLYIEQFLLVLVEMPAGGHRHAGYRAAKNTTTAPAHWWRKAELSQLQTHLRQDGTILTGARHTVGTTGGWHWGWKLPQSPTVFSPPSSKVCVWKAEGSAHPLPCHSIPHHLATRARTMSQHLHIPAQSCPEARGPRRATTPLTPLTKSVWGMRGRS